MGDKVALAILFSPGPGLPLLLSGLGRSHN
jgi:hypothetical protein